MSMFQEWEDSDATAAIIYLLLEASVFGVTFTMCYVGQILIDEVYVLCYILHTFMTSVTRLNFIQGNNVRRMSITIDWYRFHRRTYRDFSIFYIKLVLLGFNFFIFQIIKATVGYHLDNNCLYCTNFTNNVY